jgi:diaminopimelate decarboxylase
MSSEFTERDGHMHVEALALGDIAAEVGTPFYCYSSAALRSRYAALATALAALKVDIFYAVKANSNPAIIATLAAEGAGADIVSGGELRQALAAGVPAQKIVFAGVAKTEEELAFALEHGIGQFNVESFAELNSLNQVATKMQRVAPVGLRVNPDVDAGTHAKITTGRKENKFGIDIAAAPEFFKAAAAMDGISARSMSVHIGSQITNLAPFELAYRNLREMTLSLRQQGFSIDHLDLGGGLGIVYDAENEPDLSDYARIIKATVSDLDCRLSIEPGRFLTGNAGVLVTKVLLVKEGEGRDFVITDGAMNDLIRPTLYEAFHDIRPLTQRSGDARLIDVVGPICESGDYFAKSRLMQAAKAGDLLAVMGAGAYGAVMSSTYNSRPLIPEVLVDHARFHIIRPRMSYAEMLARDSLPDWLDKTKP